MQPTHSISETLVVMSQTGNMWKDIDLPPYQPTTASHLSSLKFRPCHSGQINLQPRNMGTMQKYSALKSKELLTHQTGVILPSSAFINSGYRSPTIPLVSMLGEG